VSEELLYNKMKNKIPVIQPAIRTLSPTISKIAIVLGFYTLII